MTIYARFGSEVTVVANCGEVTVKKPLPRDPKNEIVLTLLMCRFDSRDAKQNPTTHFGYYYMEGLKATNGYPEIKRAVDEAPTTYPLSHYELERAKKQAE